MKNILIGILTLMGLCLSSCTHKAAEDTPDMVMTTTQTMYDDIMQAYVAGNEGQKYAFSTYASAQLQQLLNEVEESINKGEIEPMIYGWDCDPWIMAQDWNHPSAKVIKVYNLSDNNCMADIEISDEDMNNQPTSITIMLVKEDMQWKVNDFASAESDANTFAKMLQNDYESAKNN